MDYIKRLLICAQHQMRISGIRLYFGFSMLQISTTNYSRYFQVTHCVTKINQERIEFLKDLESRKALPPFVKLIEMVKCKGREHLAQFFKNVISNKGEGVMLREPRSVYQGGRSKSLRKYKVTRFLYFELIERNSLILK
jgi:hypothetical protein